jgi:sugar/nucleoside kinase (ribokinase family)
VRIVDSVGAGDAFVAAFVGSLGTGADADAALGAGIAVSSAVLQQRGGLPAARVV